jgi:hypothetical protein
MNRRLIFAIAAAAVLAVALGMAIIQSSLTTYALRFLEAAQIIGLMEMLRNGTFISTRYFKIALVLLGLFFVGALLTMVHPTSGEAILLLSLAGILITYLIHFLRKKRKTFLDTMKLLTLVFLFPLPLLFFRPISAETKHAAILLGHLTFTVTFVLYLITGDRKAAWNFRVKDKRP